MPARCRVCSRWVKATPKGMAPYHSIRGRVCPGSDTLIKELELPVIKVGDVVTYHGSISEWHGDCCVVARVKDDGTYRVGDRYYPDQELDQVRRASITPTGETIELCPHCRHEPHWRYYGDHDRCGVYRCVCFPHPRPAAT